MSVPGGGLSLPGSLVDEARQARESAWLSSGASDLDRTVKDGMAAVGTLAGGLGEQASAFSRALAGGGLSVPSLDDLTPDWIKRQQGAQQARPTAAMDTGFSPLGPPEPVRPEPASPVGASAAAAGIGVPEVAPVRASQAAPVSPVSGPAQTGDLRAYTRAKAASLGIDPDIAERVAESEGGFDDPVRQSDVVYQGRREESYGPFQLNVRGGLGAEAIRRGHDPRDPANIYRNIDFALEQAQSGGWGPYHGAARVGIGPRQGIGPRPAAAAAAAPAAPTPTASTAGGPRWGTYTQESLSPNQFTEGQAQGLSPAEAVAVCGPAAAVAFARANGRTPTLREAKELAQAQGLWDVNVGMHGPASQVQLLAKMGVPSRLVEGTDWAQVRREVDAGRPVIVDTPLHYYTVTGYDPQTGEYEFGASAGVLRRSGGKTRWRPEELGQLGMGVPRATILMGSGGGGGG